MTAPVLAAAHPRGWALALLSLACGPTSAHRHDDGACPDHPTPTDTGDPPPEAPTWTGLRASAGTFTATFRSTSGSLGLVLPLGTREVTLTAEGSGGAFVIDGAPAPDNTWTGAVGLDGRAVDLLGPTGDRLTLFVSRGAEAPVSAIAPESSYAAAIAAHGDTLAVAAVRGGAGGRVALWQDGGAAPLATVEGAGYAEAFGAAVALNDDFLVVGAPGADGGEGRVAVYRREGDGSVTPVQELRSPTGGERALFGYALAFGGTADAPALLIGAPGLDPDGRSAAGGVFVFAWSEGSFQRSEIWQPSGLAAGERFGSAISSDGTECAVGAPGGADGGRVLRMRDGASTGWLRPPRLNPGDTFGAALHLADGELLVGAPGMDEALDGTTAQNTGRVWHFFENGRVDTYGLDQRARARLGSSIARTGPLLALGAPAMDGNAGGVLLVDVADGSSRAAFPAEANVHAGAALAFTAQTLWVGAPWSEVQSPLSTIR